MAGSDPLSHIVQHPLQQVETTAGLLTPEGKITLFSDHISMLFLAGVVLILGFPMVFKRLRDKRSIEELTPSGFANCIEAICSFIRTEVAQPNLEHHTDRFIKYIWSVFFFVLTVNLLGLLPIPAISHWAFGISLGGTATANIWTTATLAITTLIMMVGNGLRLNGKAFIAHLCPGPLWLAPLLVPIELIGMFAKTFALAVRLFANMVAGHALLAVLLSFILTAGSASAVVGFGLAIPVVAGSVAITMLEIFVAFVQAYVFTYLTTTFIGMSVVSHHDDEHGEAHS